MFGNHLFRTLRSTALVVFLLSLACAAFGDIVGPPLSLEKVSTGEEFRIDEMKADDLGRK